MEGPMFGGMMLKRLKKLVSVVFAIIFLSILSVNAKCQTYEEIIPEEAFHMIQKQKGNSDFVVIDVRTPEEFARERILGAVNIDIRSETFREEVERLPREKVYLLYCRTANRSVRAFEVFQELGFREVYHMLWGIVGWKEAGLPVVTDQ